ncbi:uncharacterized protein Dvar_55230 [Desulfosarcina variabilis str. Montpellier]
MLTESRKNNINAPLFVPRGVDLTIPYRSLINLAYLHLFIPPLGNQDVIPKKRHCNCHLFNPPYKK